MARKKKINKSVVAGLTAVGFVLVTGVGMAAVKALRKSDPVHWQRLAEGAEKEKNWEQARLYYYRAYNVSKNAQYLVNVGDMHYQSGEEMPAAYSWNQAITQTPDLISAHEKLIDLQSEIANMFPRFPRVWLALKDRADGLLVVDQQNAKGLFYLGVALRRLSEKDGGNPRRAKENVLRAAQMAPDVIDYQIAKASILLSEDENAEAEKVFQRLVDTFNEPGEDASRVRHTYGTYLGSTERKQEAEAMFEDSVRLAGDDPAVMATAKSQYAQFWTRLWYRTAIKGEETEESKVWYTKALGLLEESIALDEEGFIQYMLLSELHAFKGDRVQAILACERRISKPIRREGIKASLRKSLMHQILIKAADYCLAEAATLDRTDEEKREIRKRIIGKAEEFCQKAMAESPGNPTGMHTQGKIKLAEGNELEAIQFFRAAKAAYRAPNWRNSRTLAQLLLRQNQPGTARDEINAAFEDIDPSTKKPAADASCWTIAAQIAMRMNTPEDNAIALQHADESLRRRPGNRPALLLKIAALRAMGQTELADAITQSLGGQRPADLLIRARILHSSGNDQGALTVAMEILKENPAYIEALNMAATLLVNQDQTDVAMQLINQARAADSDNHDIAMLATRFDPNLSDEQRGKQQLSILSKITDPFARSYQTAIWYGAHDRKEEYISELEQAEHHLMSPDSPLDPASRRRQLRVLAERLFLVALSDDNSELLESVLQKVAGTKGKPATALDGVGGLTYRGRAQMHAGEHQLALTSFKSALKQQPTNADTLSYVGQCHLSTNPPQLFEARAYFERAIGANPGLLSAQKGLAIVALVQQQDAEYQARLAICAKLDSGDAWVRERLLLQQESSNPQKGVNRREEMRATDPDNVENLLALADLYQELGKQYYRAKRPAEAEQFLLKAGERYTHAIEASDSSGRVINTAANFFREIGQHDTAVELIERLVDLAATDAEKANTVLLIANHWHKVGDAQKTSDAMQRAAALKQTLEVCAAFAKIETDKKDFPAALDWYAKALVLADQSAPDLAARLSRYRIDVLFRSHEYETAETEINEFVAKYSDDVDGMLMQSAIQTVRGRIDAAIEQLGLYLEKKPGDLNAVLQRARLLYTQGRYTGTAIDDLERIKGVDSKFQNYAARTLLADGYVLIRRPDLAYNELESIVSQDPRATEVAVHLILMYGDQEKYSDAIRICTSMANRFPNNPLWVKNRADIRVRMNDNQSATADYEAAVRLSSFAPHFISSLLKAYADFGQFNKGLAFFNQSVPDAAKTPKVRLRYAELLVMNGQREEGVAQFLRVVHEGGYGNLSLIGEVNAAVVNAFQDESAIDAFRGVPGDPTLDRARRHILAMLLNHFKRNSEALSAMKSLLATAGGDEERIILLATLGNAYEREQNWEAAKESYEHIIRLDPNHLLGLNNLAFLLADKMHRPADAIPYAERAARNFPVKSVHDTLGWTYTLLGDYPQAIGIFTQILKKAPRYVPAIYHNAEAHRRSGKFEKAADLLKGAMNLIDEGFAESYRDKVRKAKRDVQRRQGS